jgi:HEAT repeat protein
MTSDKEILRQLADAGVFAGDLWDLVNTRVKYPRAIPILVDWVENLDDRVPAEDRAGLLDVLSRALAVPAARPTAANPLVARFKTVDDPSGLGLRWTIGNALEVVQDDSVFDQIIELASDPSFGRARQMVVLGLRRSRDPRAVPFLISLLKDNDVAAHAAKALGRLGDPAAQEALLAAVASPNALVRSEARQALKQIERRKARESD